MHDGSVPAIRVGLIVVLPTKVSILGFRQKLSIPNDDIFAAFTDRPLEIRSQQYENRTVEHP